MRKIALFLASLIVVMILSGCGQDLTVTVYNHSGIVSYYNEWIVMNASTERYNGGITALRSTDFDTDVNDTNSFTFQAKENDTLAINANGQYYVTDSSGNTTLTTFTVSPVTQKLSGGFPDAPKWFAAVYLDNVVIYRK